MWKKGIAVEQACVCHNEGSFPFSQRRCGGCRGTWTKGEGPVDEFEPFSAVWNFR